MVIPLSGFSIDLFQDSRRSILLRQESLFVQSNQRNCTDNKGFLLAAKGKWRRYHELQFFMKGLLGHFIGATDHPLKRIFKTRAKKQIWNFGEKAGAICNEAKIHTYNGINVDVPKVKNQFTSGKAHFDSGNEFGKMPHHSLSPLFLLPLGWNRIGNGNSIYLLAKDFVPLLKGTK